MLPSKFEVDDQYGFANISPSLIVAKLNQLLDYLEENQWQRDNVYAEGFNDGARSEVLFQIKRVLKELGTLTSSNDSDV